LASSVPSRPVEKFVSRRTSSSGSNVGPAVTMQFMAELSRGESRESRAFLHFSLRAEFLLSTLDSRLSTVKLFA